MSKARLLSQKLTEAPHTGDAPFDFAGYWGMYREFMAAVSAECIGEEELAELQPRLSMAQNLHVLGSFKNTFHYCGVSVPVPSLDDGQAAWFVEAENRTAEDPVIVYCHGGGYVQGLFPMAFGSWKLLYDETGNDRLSVVFLDYTLTDKDQYPLQCCELTRTLNYLSETCNNLFISGNSAGGHLCMSVFRHGFVPVTGVAPLKKEAMPQGLLLISPWVNLCPTEDNDKGSYITNKNKDTVQTKYLFHHGKTFALGLSESPELSPCKDTGFNWSEVIPKDKTFVYYGASELMADDIVHWAIDMAGLDKDVVYGDVGAPHDAVMGDTEGKVDARRAIVNWLKRVTTRH